MMVATIKVMIMMMMMMIEMITSMTLIMSTYHKKHPFAGSLKTPCCVEGVGLGNCSTGAFSYPEDHTVDVDYDKSEVVVVVKVIC